MANSLVTMALARVLQGMGAAGIMSVNGALVRMIYPRSLLGRGIAINSLVVATASVVGPTLAAHYFDVGSRAPQRWSQRHAGHGPTDPADVGRCVAVHHFRAI